MSVLWPAGIVCRNSSNVVVGSRPAIARLDGLCTCPAGSCSSSSTCTTSGRAATGRPCGETPPRNSCIENPSPATAITRPPHRSERASDGLRSAAVDGEHRPVDIRGAVGGQEGHRRGDLLRGPGPARGDVGGVLRRRLGRLLPRPRRPGPRPPPPPGRGGGGGAGGAPQPPVARGGVWGGETRPAAAGAAPGGAVAGASPGC